MILRNKMNLKEIIETKFMPPAIKNGYEFGIKDTINGWCSYVEQYGKQYWANNNSDDFFSLGKDRKFFPSKEEAIRRCWQHFSLNKDYYSPQETLNITKD